MPSGKKNHSPYLLDTENMLGWFGRTPSSGHVIVFAFDMEVTDNCFRSKTWIKSLDFQDSHFTEDRQKKKKSSP